MSPEEPSSHAPATPEGGPKEPSQRASGWIPQLDGVRGVAILLALLWHYIPRWGDPALEGPSSVPGLVWLREITGIAWSGVDLFFVLSGFLIGGILIDQRASSRYYRTFYTRRACRILPLYYAFLLPFLAGPWLGPGVGPWIAQAFNGDLPPWSYVVFVQNFFGALNGSFGAFWVAVTWSLAIEEQFYLVLPILVRRLPLRSLWWVLIGGIALAPASRIYLLHTGAPTAPFMGYVLAPCRGDALLAGALGAYAVRQDWLLALLRRAGRALRGVLAVLLAGAVWLTIESPGFDSVTMNTWGRTWLALLWLTLVIVVFVQADGRLARALRNPMLRWLGVHSYAIYLFHLPALGLLHAYLLHRPARIGSPLGAGVTLLALALTLALADISYRRLERPFLDLGHKYDY